MNRFIKMCHYITIKIKSLKCFVCTTVAEDVMNRTPVQILHFLLQSGPFRISAFITHFERLDVHRVYDVTSPTIQISPIRNAIFLSIYLLQLLSYPFGSMDFGLLCNLLLPTLAFNSGIQP